MKHDETEHSEHYKCDHCGKVETLSKERLVYNRMSKNTKRGALGGLVLATLAATILVARHGAGGIIAGTALAVGVFLVGRWTAWTEKLSTVTMAALVAREPTLIERAFRNQPELMELCLEAQCAVLLERCRAGHAEPKA